MLTKRLLGVPHQGGPHASSQRILSQFGQIFLGVIGIEKFLAHPIQLRCGDHETEYQDAGKLTERNPFREQASTSSAGAMHGALLRVRGCPNTAAQRLLSRAPHIHLSSLSAIEVASVRFVLGFDAPSGVIGSGLRVVV